MSIIDNLQKLYNERRTMKTWGTPTVSPFFFDKWRAKGLFRALGYLVEREKSLGNPRIPATIKTWMNITGCFLLILGVERSFLKPLKWVMYLLLFSSQGEGEPKEEPFNQDDFDFLGFANPNGPCRKGRRHNRLFSLEYGAEYCVNCKMIFPKEEEQIGNVHIPDVKPCDCAWNESCMICRPKED